MAMTLVLLGFAYFSGANAASHTGSSIEGHSSETHIVTHWGLSDGLPQITVQAIEQTSDGYLWIGTQAGLVRFDGVEFTQVSAPTLPYLANSTVWSLHEDRRDRLWIGTINGLFYKEGHKFTEVADIPDVGITGIIESSSDKIWIATSGKGIFEISGKNVRNFTKKDGLPSDAVSSIAESPDGLIQIATRNGMAYFKSGQIFVNDTQQLPSGARVQSLIYSKAGQLVAGTTIGAFLLRDGKWTEISAAEGSPLLKSRVLAATDSGPILIGSLGRLSEYDPATSSVRNIAIGAEQLMSVTQDREGNIWAGVLSRGLFRLRQRSIDALPMPGNLAGKSVLALMTDTHGTTWVSTAVGLIRFNSSGAPILEEVPSPFSGACAIHENNGMVWISTKDALYKASILNPRDYERIDVSFTSAFCALHIDDRKRLWIGSHTGIWISDDGSVINLTENNGLSSDWIKAFTSGPRGQLWIATPKGLTTISTRQPHLVLNSANQQNAINTVYFNKYGLWLGTHGNGVIRLHNRIESRIDKSHGLPSDVICSIIADNSGNIWVSTLLGIARIDASSIENSTYTDAILTFDESNGMPSRECNSGGQSVATMRENGDLWFATVRGIAIIHPNKWQIHPSQSTTIIERLFADGRLIPIDRPAVLDHETHSLEFKFTSTSLSAAEKNRFKYRLDGFETNWNETSLRRTARYTNLPPGKYVFLVKSRNSDGIWSKGESEFHFHIEPAFYKRWWFISLVSTCIISLALWLLRFRSNLQRERQAELNYRLKISRDLHDKISQTMTGIILQLDAASMSLLEPNNLASKHVSTASRLAREGIDETRRTLRGLPPIDLSDEDLGSALHRNILKITHGVSIDVNMRVIGTPRKLSATIENELFRVGQEASSNALIHGKARTIDVTLKFENNGVRLTIADNGLGFDSAQRRANSGMGLKNIEQRIQALGGWTNIISKVGSGTVIDAFVPT